MRTNFAPTSGTVIVALILMIVVLIGTYGSTPIPDQVGVLAFVVSGAMLLRLRGRGSSIPGRAPRARSRVGRTKVSD